MINVSFVLIETLWNVNKADYTVAAIRMTVLIETLWNVNDFQMT